MLLNVISSGASILHTRVSEYPHYWGRGVGPRERV